MSIAAGLLCLLLCYCQKPGSEENPDASFNVSGIVLPASLEVEKGGSVTLEVKGGHGPAITDQLQLESARSWTLPIDQVQSTSFSFTLPAELTTGDYTLSVARGTQVKRVGKTRILIQGSAGIEPGDATVYGQVVCGGAGVPGVVVSDGVEVTQTDQDGVYRLNSAKPHNYVFLSVPSGFEPLVSGLLPQIHRQLKEDPAVPERADFDLVKVDGQDNHTMLMLGDIHLARRTDDRAQFTRVVEDINATVAGLSGKVYALTLGDMTWDIYWETNNYSYREYLQDASGLQNLMVYHTIGNHDHSMYEIGDYNTVKEYKEVIGPTYYSFNIGKVHYVVLDDVECTNSKPAKDSNGKACYEREYSANLVDQQLDWLAKDLSFVPVSTPLVVTMHIPLYNANGKYRMSAAHAASLEKMLAKYSQVQLYTAHTHTIYNVDNSAGNHIFEHNAGAICATWWWSAYETPGIHICQDGTPGGYTLLKVAGTDFSWQYKGSGASADKQFRSYDRNGIALTAAQYLPSANATYKAKFDPGFWGTASSANEVYLNVWNYDPSWKVEVSENGSPLQVSQVTAMDPLHLISYTAKRLNKNKEASFPTGNTSHFFRVKASSASSTLEIKVTDPFGRVYTETMTRPKTFSTETYK